MQFIQALSLAPDVNAWLATSRQPRILHVFDQACNLINEHGRVLSIVTPQIGNGPFNLVLEDGISFLDYLNLESRVSISPAQLILGNLIIRAENAKLWNPQPDWEATHAIRDRIANQIKQLPITNYLKHSGFDTPFEGHSGLLNHRGLPSTQSLISSLSSALVNADVSAAKTITSQLAGFGIGLTPSGDDLIMGAIYAVWIIHPFEIASILARDVADTAVPLTTSLSAAWLRSAGRGEAGILWHQFFDALISVGRIGSPTYLLKAIDDILAVGETSGTDALTGFTAVLAAWMEAGSSYA